MDNKNNQYLIILILAGAIGFVYFQKNGYSLDNLFNRNKQEENWQEEMPESEVVPEEMPLERITPTPPPQEIAPTPPSRPQPRQEEPEDFCPG